MMTGSLIERVERGQFVDIKCIKSICQVRYINFFQFKYLKIVSIELVFFGPNNTSFSHLTNLHKLIMIFNKSLFNIFFFLSNIAKEEIKLKQS